MPKRGLKVRRSKSLYKKRKSGFRKAVETMMFCALLGGLVFVGIVIAQALFNYTPPKEDPVDNPVTDISKPPDDETTEQPDSDSASEEQPHLNNGELASSVYINRDALITGDSGALRAQLQSARANGFSSVVIEMKDDTGRVLYVSEVEGAAFVSEYVEAFTPILTAKQIADICAEEGVVPVARISTLKDHTAPSGVVYSGWLDNRRENGGKPWANPYSERTVSYNAEITAELYASGFENVIFANTLYPVFGSYDIPLLPEPVTNPSTNFIGLMNFLNGVSGGVPQANTLIEVKMSDFRGDDLSGSATILRNGGDSLHVKGITLIFEREYFDRFSATEDDVESVVRTAFETVRGYSGGLEILPVLDGAGISDNDRERIVEAFGKNGYENFAVKNY
ncbi:MAG: putative glycoside hydrolase [Oscillospiraceae bacterium]|nr:putative glycoside hydrolase [Oscillospiraceae bacterium]